MMNVGHFNYVTLLNLKTSNVDEQLAANIIATLGIHNSLPMKIIDGVEELLKHLGGWCNLKTRKLPISPLIQVCQTE